MEARKRANERNKAKALLRITTAGSVDDGKSTLIGRLLYESSAIYEDQLASLKKARAPASSVEGGPAASGGIDLSLVTDGLKSEREQGITIDVAYKYFSSEARKFILADAPGHVQYTRNMVTAASRADVAIILVDATLGVLEQTRRHAYLLHLLGVPQLILAINKIDRIDYDPVRIAAIEADFRALTLSCLQGLAPSLAVIPLSALTGCNVSHPSPRTLWYKGPTLLELLNTLEPRQSRLDSPQLPLQLVGRDARGRRFAAGTLQRGALHRGDEVQILPSERSSRIAKLWVQGRSEESAAPGSAIAVELEDEIDLERGQLLVLAAALAKDRETLAPTRHFSADLVWFDTEAWRHEERYLLKMGTQSTRVQIAAIDYRFDLQRLSEVPAAELTLNDIARVQLQSSRALYTAPYAEDREAGAFILVDPLSLRTVAAGMTRERLDVGQKLRPGILGRLQLVEHFEPGPLSGQLLQVPSAFLQLNSEAAQLQALGLLLELGWSVHLEKSPKAERLSRGLAQQGFASFEQGSGI